MSDANNGGVSLVYETVGERGGPAVVLVHGFAQQLVQWRHNGLAEALADQGFFVVIYDQRDAGASTQVSDWTPPTFADLRRSSAAGEAADLAYAVEDIGRDLLAVISDAGAERPVVFATSSGAAAALAAAIVEPGVIGAIVTHASLVQPTFRLGELPPGSEAIFEEAATYRYVPEQLLEAVTWLQWVGTAPGHSLDPSAARVQAEELLGRGYSAASNLRALGALLANNALWDRLGEIHAPVLALQGSDDQIIPALTHPWLAAAVVDGSTSLLEGVGYTLTSADVPAIVSAIAGVLMRGT
jgi:pimeloyl-ACP methyl ester carboxylesterase